MPASAKKLKLLKEINEQAPGQSDEDAEVTGIGSDQSVNDYGQLPDENTVQQPYSDVSIEKNFSVELVTQMPNIIASDSVDNSSEEKSFFCLSYGPFTEQQQALELMDWFTEREVTVNERIEKEHSDQLFWIYLSPQESKENAIHAVEELKKKGIKDYRLINTGDLKNAISLGLFSTQVTVNKRINELKNKGYQPIVVPYRNAKQIYWLDVKVERQSNIFAGLFDSEPSRFNSIPVSCSEIALL